MAESIDSKDGNIGRKEERYVVRIDRPGARESRDLYSHPELPEGEDVRVKIFCYNNDSIDTLILRNPGIGSNLEDLEWTEKELQEMMMEKEFELQQYQLSEEELNDRMKDIQIDIEADFPEGEFENPQIYFNESDFPPVPPRSDIFLEDRVPMPERIIRQELRDDGLTERGRKYVIELDAKSMYINGEKQPKEVYRKYRKLVEGTVEMTFETDKTYKIIF